MAAITSPTSALASRLDVARTRRPQVRAKYSALIPRAVVTRSGHTSMTPPNEKCVLAKHLQSRVRLATGAGAHQRRGVSLLPRSTAGGASAAPSSGDDAGAASTPPPPGLVKGFVRGLRGRMAADANFPFKLVRVARFPNPTTVYSPSLSALLVTLLVLLVTLLVTFTTNGNCLYKPTLADSRLTLSFLHRKGAEVTLDEFMTVLVNVGVRGDPTGWLLGGKLQVLCQMLTAAVNDVILVYCLAPVKDDGSAAAAKKEKSAEPEIAHVFQEGDFTTGQRIRCYLDKGKFYAGVGALSCTLSMFLALALSGQMQKITPEYLFRALMTGALHMGISGTYCVSQIPRLFTDPL